jgi:hypothetical protein
MRRMRRPTRAGLASEDALEVADGGSGLPSDDGRAMRNWICRLLALTALALTGGSDAAPAAWSSLETIGAPARADLAYWPDGTALVTWRDVPARTPTDDVANPGSALSYVAVRLCDGRRVTRLTTARRGRRAGIWQGRLVVLRQAQRTRIRRP